MTKYYESVMSGEEKKRKRRHVSKIDHLQETSNIELQIHTRKTVYIDNSPV